MVFSPLPSWDQNQDLMNYKFKIKFKIKFNEFPVLVKCALHIEVDISLHWPFSLPKNDRAEVVSQPPKVYGKGGAYLNFYSRRSSHAVTFSCFPKFTVLLLFIQGMTETLILNSAELTSVNVSKKTKPVELRLSTDQMIFFSPSPLTSTKCRTWPRQYISIANSAVSINHRPRPLQKGLCSGLFDFLTLGPLKNQIS